MKDSILMLVPAGDTIPPEVVPGWMELARLLRAAGMAVGTLVVPRQRMGPAAARSEAMRHAGPDPGDWILWLDADEQLVEPARVAGMIGWARIRAVDSVSGAARLKIDPGGPPRYGVWLDDPPIPYVDPPEWTGPRWLRARGTGAGCWLWSRRAWTAAWSRGPQPWRYGTTPAGGLLGEDREMTQYLDDAGIVTWCDPGVEIGHIGPWTWYGRLADDLEVVP